MASSIPLGSTAGHAFRIAGSSTINSQIAIRAVPDDLDRWEAAGCTGWEWDEMLPYFRKLETDKNFPDAPYHGDHGPIPGVSCTAAGLGKRGPGAATIRTRNRLWLV
jgi:choline dehydrogenase-like flavoprotein